MAEIIIPSSDDIVTINRKLGGAILNPGSIDGNKRTAAETMKLFMKQNNFRLNTPLGGLVYISLKIANSEISYSELIEWIYRRLEHGNL